MRIVAKIFGCNYETYKKIYKDAIKRVYERNKISINPEEIEVVIDELPGATIQAQRSVTRHTRTISVYEDDELKYIIGFSHTNYD